MMTPQQRFVAGSLLLIAANAVVCAIEPLVGQVMSALLLGFIGIGLIVSADA
jgi:hypothetical protein